jgi:hypothetical protein
MGDKVSVIGSQACAKTSESTYREILAVSREIFLYGMLRGGVTMSKRSIPTTGSFWRCCLQDGGVRFRPPPRLSPRAATRSHPQDRF